MSKTIEILGEKAEYYLSHVCRTIDKKLLYLPAPDTVDRVWICLLYTSPSPRDTR